MCLLWEGGFVGCLSIMVEMLRWAVRVFGALFERWMGDGCFE